LNGAAVLYFEFGFELVSTVSGGARPWLGFAAFGEAAFNG
jgi:hypothetical protein